MTEKLKTMVANAINVFNVVSGSGTVCKASFEALVSLVNELSFADIKLPARLFSRSDSVVRSNNPIEYLPVYEDRNVSVGVFIIKHGSKIPLHDHPRMHGMLKVLKGELDITSYNVSFDDFVSARPSSHVFFSKPLEVTRNSTVRLTASSGCSILSPTLSNVHEVHCVTGPAVFLDILAPPYSDDQSEAAPRSCHYFRVEEAGENRFRLFQIPCPEAYLNNSFEEGD